MEWLFALVPVALGGAMCVGGAVLAALGVRAQIGGDHVDSDVAQR